MYLLVPLQKTMVISEMSNVQKEVHTNGVNLITCQDLEALKKTRILATCSSIPFLFETRCYIEDRVSSALYSQIIGCRIRSYYKHLLFFRISAFKIPQLLWYKPEIPNPNTELWCERWKEKDFVIICWYLWKLKKTSLNIGFAWLFDIIFCHCYNPIYLE